MLPTTACAIWVYVANDVIFIRVQHTVRQSAQQYQQVLATSLATQIANAWSLDDA